MTPEGKVTLYDKWDRYPRKRDSYTSTDRRLMMETMALGIDVAKAKLDGCILSSDGHAYYQQVANTADGHAALHEWVQQHTPQRLPVCLEATGVYGDAIALFLHQHGYRVSVVNPAPVKHFGMALMKRHKTDKSDAQVLAAYCLHQPPPLWQPPSLSQSHLHDLKRLADDLQSDRIRLKNRLEGTRPDSPARRYLQDQLEYVEKQLAQIEAELKQQLDHDDHLRTHCDLLTSIIGIGQASALQVLAELPDLTHFTSADELVAYAGLCPHQQQSGARLNHSWLSKQGSAHLRKALYFPALTAKQHNPHLRRFAERLAAAGKAKMVVVAAVMRKLLVLIYAILKSGHPYDPNYGFST
jgi:transposase